MESKAGSRKVVPVLEMLRYTQPMFSRRDFLVAGISASAAPLFASPRPAPARSCIFLVLTGGPSQIDTWDPKPDAPSTHRSPWKAIPTNVEGIQLTELFPNMARQADKFTLVRSVYHDGPAVHETGLQLIQTGYAFDGTEQPHVGACHSVLNPLGNTGSGCDVPNGQAGLLPVRPVASKNWERYGRTRFGLSCLHAANMVEAGAPFVTVNMFDTVFDANTWDSHGTSPFSSMKSYETHVAPAFDKAYAALLADLSERGLLDSTLVVASGEFGRTPRINPVGGRDHWPQCWTALLAGAGIPGGQVYGSSDATASEPKDQPVHASRIAATIAAKLGMHHAVEPLS